ncbi:hypothetical protein KA001_01380 [Patescibacteria group bacterium]|nr:hypothetical protein [Patescibacteria group bacterium]
MPTIRLQNLRDYLVKLANRHFLDPETLRALINYSYKLETGELKANAGTKEDTLNRLTFLLTGVPVTLKVDPIVLTGKQALAIAQLYDAENPEDRVTRDQYLSKESKLGILCDMSDNIARAVRNRGYDKPEGDGKDSVHVGQTIFNEAVAINPLLRDTVVLETDGEGRIQATLANNPEIKAEYSVS